METGESGLIIWTCTVIFVLLFTMMNVAMLPWRSERVGRYEIIEVMNRGKEEIDIEVHLDFSDVMKMFFGPT